ncbi:MAG: hypothetical protein F4X80_08560 [Chloroflexi bacterium]|nr:hypothetical protein [Chloroflexota bacterium]
MASDPISISQELRAAGFTEEQSTLLATQMAARADDLVTKLDLERAVAEIELKIAQLDHKLTSAIQELDHRLTGEIRALDHKLTGEIERVDHKLTGEIKRLDYKIDLLDQKVDGLESRLVVKLGVMMATGFGLLLAAVAIAAGQVG